ncbi:MAG TPA: adenylyltransferase/cytidyltransferase family protein [Candidatus Elarobacter sp.]|nr:adenylyltransferase/cytidyltransferase family protein [Candidatus Elarobacter sp.]
MTPNGFDGLILDVERAVAWREQMREEKTAVVTTNGVFDLLHAGHTAYLSWARMQGGALLVLINEDESVRLLGKGPGRPLVPFADRARVVAALRSVDAVVGFAQRTPEVLLDRLRADVHVKSAQYRIEELPERFVVEKHGGRIVLAPHQPGRSTTDLVAAIRSL